ncbi:MAG: DUF2779 domain-containing protein [Gammaproteobacteria bacterium]|nr:MAG: DUF2779 domain-containing protein [Gammaproteobacteria bacterium]
MNISKSLYIKGLQCHKALWLKKYNKGVLTKPNAAAEALFVAGNEVGELACKLFPDGVEVEFNPQDYDGMTAATSQLIKDGTKNIYEASFIYNGVFVAVDILHINDDKSVQIYEVKSSTGVYKNKKKTKLKDEYVNDVSIQYYVLNGLGFKVEKICLVHLNNKYVRDKKLDIKKLFNFFDMTDEAINEQQNINTNLADFKKILSDKKNEPKIDIGEHCNKPYDCDAIKKHCWQHIPKYSVFDIGGIRKKKAFKLYKKGIIKFDQITDIDNFSDGQKIQIEAEQTGKSIIDKNAIREFLGGLTYPIYHLDFETFMPAIPLWNGTKPYTNIPTQYSIHIQQQNGDLEHKEFLSQAGADPRYELSQKLVQNIPPDVTVLTYNMSFEQGRIKELAEEFEEFAEHLMKIHDNIQDLMMSFSKKHYYAPAMKGSYSIKYVLPALVPDSSSYEDLTGAKDGMAAMNDYAKLTTTTDPQETTQIRKDLLEYCKLDTLAMVKILKVLSESVL